MIQKVKTGDVIDAFVRRLSSIGIKVSLVGCLPWIYLHSVNGVRVGGTFRAEHGFTAFFLSMNKGKGNKFSDRRVVFKKVREVLDSVNVPKD